MIEEMERALTLVYGRRRGAEGAAAAGKDADSARGDAEEEAWQVGLAEMMEGMLEQMAMKKQQSALRRARERGGKQRVSAEADDEYGASASLGSGRDSCASLTHVQSFLERDRQQKAELERQRLERQRKQHRGSLPVRAASFLQDEEDFSGEISGKLEEESELLAVARNLRPDFPPTCPPPSTRARPIRRDLAGGARALSGQDAAHPDPPEAHAPAEPVAAACLCGGGRHGPGREGGGGGARRPDASEPTAAGTPLAHPCISVSLCAAP